jgi:DNA-binding LacI/PurR family transcriptional regulator
MITQKKLAQQIGVSASTISLALSGSPKVNKKTRQLVLDAVEATGYRPNQNALALQHLGTKTIGVIFPSFFNSYYNELKQEIHPLLSDAGYTGLFFNVANQEDYRKTVDELHGRGVSGIISGVDNPEVLAPLCRMGLPLVFYHHSGAVPCSSVDVDREKGGLMAGRHLISLGYRKLAYLGKSKNGLEPRLQGFMTAISEAGLELPAAYIVDMGADAGEGMEHGYEGMKQLLHLPEPPRAVFAFNDSTAIGAIRAVYDAGLKVPDDIAIVGFANSRESRFHVPSLTTIGQPLKETAENLVSLLLKRLSGESVEIRRIVLEPELIIRESCGATGGIK